ncbi:MAG TPA: tetratricopeptide repeat protein [Acidobacteriaceae bacterium]|nr:tetratricopeptide repeat protein [Acidobacteriaceae bacterium]
MLKQRGCGWRVALAILLAAMATRCPGQVASSSTDRQTAIALEQRGDNAGAETAWRALLTEDPASAEAYAHLGFLEARQGHYTEAVPLYRKALALDPAMPSLRLNLGLALFKSDALKEAIETLIPLLSSEPPSSPEVQRLNVLIGMGYYGLGENAAAVAYLKAAAARDPQSLQLRLTLAQSCMKSKQFQCVLDVYQEILMLNAESAEADMLAGEALEEMKDDPGAIQQFRAAVKANDKEPNAHYSLGYLLWKMKQYREAAHEFEAELANVPNHVQALAYLGDAEMRLQDPQATPHLLEAVRIDPQMKLAHLDLGILYSDAGRRDDALRELREAAVLSPNDVDVHWRLGRLYQAAGMRDEAKAEFDKTRTLQKAADNPISAEPHDAQNTTQRAPHD